MDFHMMPPIQSLWEFISAGRGVHRYSYALEVEVATSTRLKDLGKQQYKSMIYSTQTPDEVLLTAENTDRTYR